MQHFIFSVTADPRTNERRPAAEILDEAERRGAWYVAARTRHVRDLREGDDILFYVTGTQQKQAKQLVARGRVAGPPVPYAAGPRSWTGLATQGVVEVPIRDLVRFAKPIHIESLVGRLGFIRNPESWGSSLMGRITKVPDEDYQIILSDSLATESGR